MGFSITPIPPIVTQYTLYKRNTQDSLPFAIIGSDDFITMNGARTRGRQYPWGAVEGMVTCLQWNEMIYGIDFAKVDNPEHSDFAKLRSALLR
jgi:cell division control protein 11